MRPKVMRKQKKKKKSSCSLALALKKTSQQTNSQLREVRTSPETELSFVSIAVGATHRMQAGK
jgi:hypothetical protein